MSLFDSPLPPPAEETKRKWVEYLSATPVYTTDLMQYRHGYLSNTPLESSLSMMAAQHRAIPVPHPENKHYTEIEEAKRNRAEAERMAKMNQRVHIHGVEQRAPWIPPHEHPDLLRFRPNIRHFQNPKRFFRMPPW